MGRASETLGRISVTMVLKTVSANKTVTPEKGEIYTVCANIDVTPK